MINLAISKDTMPDHAHNSMIPLKFLKPWEGNVRKTLPESDIGEMAASIAAHSLLQPLIVRDMQDGTFEVVAGVRRLAGLNVLASEGTLTREDLIECRVLPKDASLEEVSLAENTVRQAMHPTDECVAFQNLIDAGNTPAEIATRFGKSVNTVERRLKLARVAPAIFQACRDGKVTLAQLQAYAITDDRDRQMRVFERHAIDDEPQYIRDELTEDEIPASDKRVRFVGREVYEQHDGPVHLDLFAEEEEGVFILDPVLLDKLVQNKANSLIEQYTAQGWSWVEFATEYNYNKLNQMEQVYTKNFRDLPPEIQAERDRLQAEHDELEKIDADAATEEQNDRWLEIEDRMEEIDNGREKIWPDTVKKKAGLMLILQHNGILEIRCYKKKNEKAAVGPDKKSKTDTLGKDDDSDDGEDTGITQAPDDEISYPAALVKDLTAHKTAAIAAVLVTKPDLALVVLVHKFAGHLLYDASIDSCLKSNLHQTHLSPKVQDPETCRGFKQLESFKEKWGNIIPEDEAEFWAWCLEARPEQLMELLALCVALCIDGQHERFTEDDFPENALAVALGVHMPSWFCPTVENFYGRVNKPTLLAALKDATGEAATPAILKLKKSELAEHAEREILKLNAEWIPAPLRLPEAQKCRP